MKNLDKIRVLLEKYYEGETNRNEEEILKSFFLSGKVPADMESDRQLFLSLHEESLLRVPGGEGFEERFFGSVSGNKKSELKSNRAIYMRFAAIAASFLLIAGSYFLIVHEYGIEGNGHDYQVYSPEDPEKAYEEAKSALLMVSSVMNRGTAELEKLSRFEDARSEMNAISKFHDAVQIIGK